MLKSKHNSMFIFECLRSDNAREYFSTPFTSFMSQHGILHQSSCAHTTQQNGVAERKNRHLVETTHTLLLHSHVPFRFLGDVVLTTCYLINRMPSSILHDQIPHSLLFLPNLFISFLLVSLAVLVLFILSHLDRTSSPPRLRNASSWVLSTSEGLSLLFP